MVGQANLTRKRADFEVTPTHIMSSAAKLSKMILITTSQDFTPNNQGQKWDKQDQEHAVARERRFKNAGHFEAHTGWNVGTSQEPLAFFSECQSGRLDRPRRKSLDNRRRR